MTFPAPRPQASARAHRLAFSLTLQAASFSAGMDEGTMAQRKYAQNTMKNGNQTKMTNTLQPISRRYRNALLRTDTSVMPTSKGETVHHYDA